MRRVGKEAGRRGRHIVVCLENNLACSACHRCGTPLAAFQADHCAAGVLCLPATPLAAFRLLDVPLRVHLRRRALRGTPLPAHITPLFSRQTTVLPGRQPGVLCLPATPLAAFRLLDVPLRVHLRRRALRGTPLPAHITPLFSRRDHCAAWKTTWRALLASDAPRCVPPPRCTAAGTPSSAGLARDAAAGPYHAAFPQADHCDARR